MKIGIIIGRIGGIDGVALETEKWIQVLENMGHKMFVITGLLERPLKGKYTILPELNFYHPLTIREQKNAFFIQNIEEDVLLKQLEQTTAHIEKNILAWLVKYKIDLIISENASALPCHLAMGLAINNILEETEIPCICHDHDFHWERGDRYKSKFQSIKKIVKGFPVNLPNVKHAVINQQGFRDLQNQNIESIVIPNVMDFNENYGSLDDYNKTLKKDLKLEQDDILLFQITRIVRRKGIETAIKLIHKLENKKIKLIVTGSALDDHNRDYYCELMDLTTKLDLEDQIVFGAESFANFRHTNAITTTGNFKSKIYSLSDGYANATACTYFSTYEGFGNAFVECVLAKKPIFVNNYKPVYSEDIGSKGFKTVMLEDNNLTDDKINNIKDVLINKKLANDIGEFNFELGKKHFSFEVLEELLKKLL